MTKAFINADLLSKMRPIPHFFPIHFFIKNGVFTPTITSENFP